MPLSSDDDEDSDAIRAVFAWSLRALPADTARMFRLLGQHPGPDFSSGAASALAGVGRDAARRLLDSLARAHLVEQRAEDRYQFHDLLRAYAGDQLRQEESAEDRAEALRRELSWYVRTGLNASAAAQTIIEPVVGRVEAPIVQPEDFASLSDAVEWYDRERANLVALTHAAAAAGLEDLAWQLPSAVYPVSNVLRASFDDVLEMNAVALAAARAAGAQRAEAAILGNLGVACQMANRNDEAEVHSLASIELAREIGDRFAVMRGSNSLGWSYLSRRRLEEAIVHFTATREAAEGIPEAAKWAASAQRNLALTHVALERLDEAAELAESGFPGRAETADPRLLFDAAHLLARIRTIQGRWDEAAGLLDLADEAVEQIGSQAYGGIVALERGRLALAQGRYDEGLVAFHLSAEIANASRDRSLEGQAYEGAGAAYLGLERLDEAVDFLQTAARLLLRRGGDPWRSALALERLATALEAKGDLPGAREQRQAGLSTIAPFSDPPSLALRARLETALGPAL